MSPHIVYVEVCISLGKIHGTLLRASAMYCIDVIGSVRSGGILLGDGVLDSFEFVKRSTVILT